MTTHLVQVAPDVWVATSRRYETTSTVLLDGRGGALVIDPAWDADELAAIPEDLKSLGVRCVAGLATHYHYDHILWHAELGEVPRWTSPWTAQSVASNREQVLAPLVGDLSEELLDLAGRLTPLPGDTVPWDGPVIRCWTHDAHAPAHLALEVEASGVVVAGDMLSDVELPMPDEGVPDLVSYLAGLDVLADVVRRARLLVPGHGTPTNRPLERLDADRFYLDAVLAGRPVEDARLGNEGMAELHAANLALALNTPS